MTYPNVGEEPDQRWPTEREALASSNHPRLMAEKSIGEEHFTARLKDNARYMCKSVAIYQLGGIDSIFYPFCFSFIHYGGGVGVFTPRQRS